MKITRPDLLDLLTLAEPLACVRHAHKRLPASFDPRTVTIFGAGPIGMLHLIETRTLYPKAAFQIVEPDLDRRQLVTDRFAFAHLYARAADVRPSDLTIVATSAPAASMAAIEATVAPGMVVLFSGIDHQTAADLPRVDGHDLEAIHRHEEVRLTSGGVRLVGSSGYHRSEIDEAAALLMRFPARYRPVQTAVIDGIDGDRLDGPRHEGPSIIGLLTADHLARRHLKVVFRLDRANGRHKRIVAADADGGVALERFAAAPLVQGHVRVRMMRVSICQTDRRVLKKTKAATLQPGLVLGHEGIGVVEEVGVDVMRSLNGRLCIVLPHCFAADDPYEPRGIGYLSSAMRHLGIHVNGTFATLADFPAICVSPLSQRLVDLLSDDERPRSDAGAPALAAV